MILENQMAKKTGLTTGRREGPRKRAEQQRSIVTRALILDAAIEEFAERGFEGASIRAIADRLGLQHPLITYHYRSKDILWRAAAEHAFAKIRTEWDISAPEGSDLSPLARLRQEYTTLFPVHGRVSRISSLHAAGDLDEQSATEMGGRNGAGPAFGTIAASNNHGPATGIASHGQSHSFPLHDGQLDRDALRVRA